MPANACIQVIHCKPSLAESRDRCNDFLQRVRLPGGAGAPQLSGGTDGYNPDGGLVADAAGNLYGTSTWGGPNVASPYGSVFELSPPATAGGDWTKTVIYSFQGGPNDGATPFGTLIFDKAGNLYGTTQAGGSNSMGTVFELSPPAVAGGDWTETVLYIFAADGSEGYWPFGRLTFDGIGNLYATLEYGGSGRSGSNCSIGGCGTVVQLRPPAEQGGAWTCNVLHNFGSSPSDGTEPGRGLAFRAGALYGTTLSGGTASSGTIFQLTVNKGVWNEKVLYNFTGSEGATPLGRLIVDPAGNLYGTVRSGGIANSATCPLGCGAVFELSPPTVPTDPWQETTLYQFTGGPDGGSPYTAVLRDIQGRLYGAASVGGANNWENTGEQWHGVPVESASRPRGLMEADPSARLSRDQLRRRKFSCGRSDPDQRFRPLRHHSRRRHH